MQRFKLRMSQTSESWEKNEVKQSSFLNSIHTDHWNRPSSQSFTRQRNAIWQGRMSLSQVLNTVLPKLYKAVSFYSVPCSGIHKGEEIFFHVFCLHDYMY